MAGAESTGRQEQKLIVGERLLFGSDRNYLNQRFERLEQLERLERLHCGLAGW